ncbi:RNA polymerase III subunit C82, partial [Tulasnella sp. 427]
PRAKKREVRLALLVLIQHNIVWHSEDEIDGEVYEINWEEPVARLRFGRYIMIVRDKLGDTAAEVLSFVLDNGKLKEEIFFKVNYPKLNTCIRNEIIVEAALHRYNSQTAEVLRAALKVTEDKQQNLLDYRSEPVGSHDISSKLSSTSVLHNGIRTGKKSYSPTVKEYLAILCNDDNHTPAGLASAFMAPVTGGGGSGRVTVEFDRIGRRLKQRVYESNVRERFGDDAVKVIRILLDKGKMDEKHLSKVALIAPNVLRPLLTRLSAASLVSLQEVPKSADRNPSRTYYLWYVDLAKAYSNLLSALYQTLANIVARTVEEESQVRPSLDKRDRTDLNGQEHLLNRHDLAVLNVWEEKQERLHILAMRVEENVFILRDMLGDPEPER